MYELSEFGAKLRAKLDRIGWSRNTLAEASGMNPTTLWRWMVGKGSPSIDEAVLIASAIGCDAADLLPKKPR